MKKGSRLGMKKDYEPLWIAIRLTQLPLQAQFDTAMQTATKAQTQGEDVKVDEAAAVVWRHRV